MNLEIELSRILLNYLDRYGLLYSNFSAESLNLDIKDLVIDDLNNRSYTVSSNENRINGETIQWILHKIGIVNNIDIKYSDNKILDFILESKSFMLYYSDSTFDQYQKKSYLDSISKLKKSRKYNDWNLGLIWLRIKSYKEINNFDDPWYVNDFNKITYRLIAIYDKEMNLLFQDSLINKILNKEISTLNLL